MNDIKSLDEVTAQLQLLRENYAAELPARIEKIRALNEHYSIRPTDTAALRELHRMAHGLSGSGKTYGFSKLSDESRALEANLLEVMEGRAAHDAVAVETHIRRMAALSLAPDGQAAPFEEHLLAAHSPWRGTENRLIYVVEDDELFATDIALQIGTFGYTVRCYENTTQLREAVESEVPAAIVADVILAEGDSAGFDAVRDVQRLSETHIPVLFISARADIDARLEGVRAGGDAYFTKPLDAADLVDKLDTLTEHEVPEPYRILVVDDEPALAAYFALTLQGAGMSTLVVNNPLKVMPALVDFRPDLILMDVYMPQCTGLELATVIRQQEDFVSIPIVFLSAEKSIDKQLAAMSSGADDFLEKPIGAEHLISSVMTRAKRSRQLRSFMIRDSLTGLLNHTTIKERLAIEVARAARGDGTISFAMVDIDNFKSINDRFGHLVGDRVIKSLSRLLNQRLRKTDIIGRYGGEEFAVILSDTDGETAEQVLDKIRVGFSQLHHRTTEVDFEVTFSCGVAEFPEFDDAAILNDAADKALYEAKRTGKNKIVRAKRTK
ncbi:MAG TPA: diguanylate cyclase [Abditibacteriaceae bacterium]|jgi:diguanylate cyclase (GGDEF)-like protein